MAIWWSGSGLMDLLKQVWREGVTPKDWKTSVIVPIFKKGDQEKEENYRGISLLSTAYKVYAEILRNRLEREVDRLNLLPEIQGGFRRERGTMDNIFILKHVVQRERRKEDNKVYAVFVDLKAAFDNVGREKLWSILEDKGVDRGLVERLQRIYERTK